MASKPNLPIIKRALAASNVLACAVLAGFIKAVGAEGILLLGKKLANGDAPLSLGFEHAHAGGPERGVLPVGGLNQGVEHGILKHRPPRAHISSARA